MKKKILFLGMRFPYPPHGGEKIAMFNFLRSIKDEDFEVDLIAFEDGERITHQQIEDLKAEIPNLRKCEVIYLPFPLRYFGALLALLGQKPMQVGYFSNFDSIKKLKKIVSHETYDTVFIHSIRLFPQIQHIKHTKKVLYFVDAISMNYENAVDKLSGLKKWLYQIEVRFLKKYENQLLHQTDIGIFHSSVDTEYLGWKNHPKIKHISIAGTPISSFKPITSDTPKRFAFIANFKALPNQKGVTYLLSLDEKLAEKNLKIVLVGVNLPENLMRKVKESKSLQYLGKVDDVQEVIIDSYGAICPIEIGAGMQNKILDALSAGRPAIATSYTANAYLTYLEKHQLNEGESGLIIYSKNNELIQKLEELISNQKLSNELGANALKTAKYFSLNFIKEEIKPLF